MIRTILVPATGSDTDAGVFASALTAARPLDAHLAFLHISMDAATFAAAIMPEVSSGQVFTDVINRMGEEAQQREQKAKQLFESFCRREGLVVAGTSSTLSEGSARWLRADGSESYWLVEHARTVDLLVIGRPDDDQRFPPDLLEAALINSGRPLLIAPSAPMSALPDTIVIAWKSTPEAARAVSAAMPFLPFAKQIVIMTVAEDEITVEEQGAARLMTNLRWDGFATSVRRLEPSAQGAAETLLMAAREQAALLVMGGYGHSRLREWIFGGFTQRILQGAELAGACSLAEGNALLPAFIADYNVRFAKPPANAKDLHRPLGAGEDLEDAFAWKEERTLSQALTLQYDKVIFILEPSDQAKAAIGKRVTVVDYPDGRLSIRYKGVALAYRTFDELRHVPQAAIVENKRLGAVLALIREQQIERAEVRSRKAPRRRDQRDARLFKVG